MLEKSLASPADSVCYDLEDSVAPGKKADARRAIVELLNVSEGDYIWPNVGLAKFIRISTLARQKGRQSILGIC